MILSCRGLECLLSHRQLHIVYETCGVFAAAVAAVHGCCPPECDARDKDLLVSCRKRAIDGVACAGQSQRREAQARRKGSAARRSDKGFAGPKVGWAFPTQEEYEMGGCLHRDGAPFPGEVLQDSTAATLAVSNLLACGRLNDRLLASPHAD